MPLQYSPLYLVDDFALVAEELHYFELAAPHHVLDLVLLHLLVSVYHTQRQLVEADAWEPVRVPFELNYLLVPGVKQAVELHVDELPPYPLTMLSPVLDELLSLPQIAEGLLLEGLVAEKPLVLVPQAGHSLTG